MPSPLTPKDADLFLAKVTNCSLLKSPLVDATSAEKGENRTEFRRESGVASKNPAAPRSAAASKAVAASKTTADSTFKDAVGSEAVVGSEAAVEDDQTPPGPRLPRTAFQRCSALKSLKENYANEMKRTKWPFHVSRTSETDYKKRMRMSS